MSEQGSAEEARILAELEAARRAFLVEARPDLGTIVVRGKDRKSWLNGLVTCDLAPRKSGDGVFGLAVQKSGKLLAELFVALEPERVVVGAPRARVATLLAHFDKHLIMEDVELDDGSEQEGWLVLHGAGAGQTAKRAGGLELDATGLGGGVLVRARAELDAARAALLAHEGALEASPEGLTQLFVSNGVGRFGVDYGDEHYPQEAALEGRAVSFEKGCYLGQEAVFMLQARGHAKRRLVTLAVEGAGHIEAGAPVLGPDGAEVGAVTSEAPLPTAPAGDEPARRLVLAFLKHKFLPGEKAAGSALSVQGRGARVKG